MLKQIRKVKSRNTNKGKTDQYGGTGTMGIGGSLKCVQQYLIDHPESSDFDLKTIKNLTLLRREIRGEDDPEVTIEQTESLCRIRDRLIPDGWNTHDKTKWSRSKTQTRQRHSLRDDI